MPPAVRVRWHRVDPCRSVPGFAIRPDVRCPRTFGTSKKSNLDCGEGSTDGNFFKGEGGGHGGARL